MRKKLICLAFVLSALCTNAQENSRNGYTYAPYGTLNIFVVFADIIDDTCTAIIPNWNSGELPSYADEMFDDDLENDPIGFVSKYFNEASFGTLRVIGDYYPELLEFYSSEITGNGCVSIVNRLHNLSNTDIITANGHYLSEFDNWTPPSPRRSYYALTNASDNKIDLLVIVWRRNSQFRAERNGGEFCIPETSNPLLYSSINGYIVIYHNNPSEVFCHEFGHALIGDNEYHSGGAGRGFFRHFLSNLGGYSMISSHNHNLSFCNGWDRWWLGWKHPDKDTIISALDINMTEICTDFIYGEPFSTTDYVLRDFAKYGDAIRIKLPYLLPTTRNQYLWIENHQIRTESTEYENGRSKGIRINIQIGNDILNDNLLEGSRANYIVPLSSFGNYDFNYDTLHVPNPKCVRAFAYETSANPFCGYHPAMMPAFDYDKDDLILPDEFYAIWNIYLNNILKIDGITVYGNVYDVFAVGSKLNISSNPPPIPLLTRRTRNREMCEIINTAPDDNKKIWLNGLCVEIVEEYADGSIRIRLSWDYFDVDNDVRWCGPIILTEKVILKATNTITLDYGLTPVSPQYQLLLNGRKIFASPTTFTCQNNSYFKQESNSTVNVKNQSALILEAGSLYEVGDGAVLDIKATGCLHVKSGATLRVSGTGHVEIENGAYICIDDGANIELVDILSSVNLHTGYLLGTPSGGSSCTSTPLTSFALTAGSAGSIRGFGGPRFIQNTVYTGDAYELWQSIQAGHHVTNQVSLGNVILEDGSHVIMDAEGDVRLEPGVEVNQGAILEVR